MNAPTPVRQLTIFGTTEPARDKSADRITPFGPGYPARPGSGPPGEVCGNCVHLMRLHFKRGRSRVVFKCDRVEGWEHNNRLTDIRRSSPACMGFERPADYAIKDESHEPKS